MKNIVCPISSERMPEHIARLNALFTVLFLVVYVITENLLFPLLLTADFFSRSYLNGKYSFISFASKWVSAQLSITSKQVDKAPKIFAARLGLLFALLLTVLVAFQLFTAALVVALLFAACALLEVVFSFCVGCLIYTFINHSFLRVV